MHTTPNVRTDVEVINLSDITGDAPGETKGEDVTGPPARRSQREHNAPVRLMYYRLGIQAKVAEALTAREEAWAVAMAFFVVQA